MRLESRHVEVLLQSSFNPDGLLAVLRDRIAGHEIPPGSKLAEGALCSEFGVWCTGVREVPGGLTEQGSVMRAPNQSAAVAKLDVEQAAQRYAVREGWEGLRARLAAEAGTRAPIRSSLDCLRRYQPFVLYP